MYTSNSFNVNANVSDVYNCPRSWSLFSSFLWVGEQWRLCIKPVRIIHLHKKDLFTGCLRCGRFLCGFWFLCGVRLLRSFRFLCGVRLLRSFRFLCGFRLFCCFWHLCGVWLLCSVGLLCGIRFVRCRRRALRGDRTLGRWYELHQGTVTQNVRDVLTEDCSLNFEI